MIRQFIIVFILIMPTLFFGQSNIKYYTLEEGLSEAIINDLLLDKDGFVWVAAQDGLNRFDGQEFKVFTNIRNDSTSLPGNLIYRLFEDSKARIWVGTYGKGLSIYNKSSESFKRVPLENFSDDNETITGIVEDSAGNIWVSSINNGLHKLRVSENGIQQKSYFKGTPFNTLQVDLKGNIWAANTNGDLYRFNPLVEDSINDTPLISINQQVNTLFDNGENLFIGTNEGLFIYNYFNKKISQHELTNEHQAPVRIVTDIVDAGGSKLWLATDVGLFLFDAENFKVNNTIQDADGNKIGLSNSKVTSVLQLPNNLLLVGTMRYLNLIDFNEPYFKNISKDKRGKHLLNDNMVFAILKYKNDLWVGTSNGGLNLIRDDKVYYFKENKFVASSISGLLVRKIALDEKNQRIWIATSAGLNMIDLKSFNPENPKFINFKHYTDYDNLLNNNYLKDIALDDQGYLWGATYGKGIFRLKYLNNGQINVHIFKKNKDNDNSLISDAAHCIRTNKNDIWIGTQNGLSKLHFENNNFQNPIFTHYQANPDNENSLSNNWIYDVEIDSNNRVWVSTRNGLNLLTGDNEFKSWTVQEQFPNAVVYCVLEDFYGHMWLSTNDGIVRFDPNNESFTHYGYMDGIQNREFNIHAKYRDENGIIFLGGIEGFTYFNPKDLNTIDDAKPLYFSELWLKNKLISPNNSKNSNLKQSILLTKDLSFKHNEFPFFLKFSSIDFRQQKNVDFAYKLSPIDNEWNILKKPEIQLLTLPAGNYKLFINGFSRGKEWNTPPISMNLNILPPWWNTWWAYLIYALLLGLLIFGLYQFQLSRKLALAERNRLQEIDSLKNMLYTSITHELRTPLTVILGIANSLKENNKDKILKESIRSLKMIERNGQKLMRLVNEMLDLAKLESGHLELELVQADIVPYIKYLSESFQSLAQVKKIELFVYSEVDNLMMDFDSAKMATVVSNLLSNAIKFTPHGGKVITHLKRNGDDKQAQFYLKIKDTGYGIPEKDIKHIFDRFYQAGISDNHRTEGSGIGLALTKELVELMNGTISVKSKLKEGSEFTVQIPISNIAPFSNDLPQHDQIPVKPEPITDQIEMEEEHKGDKPLILIIEDNYDVAEYLKVCLSGKYYSEHAIDGVQGVEKAYELIPDLVITDVMMPNKDGFEVCDELKSDERTDHIPIVILTAKATAEDKIKGLGRGADAYIAKPFLQEELLTRLNQLIALRKKLFKKFEKTDFDIFINKKFTEPETIFIQKVIKIVYDHMEDHHFQSVELAQKLMMSKSQLYRKLKAINGKSIAVFIRSIRLQRARQLLETTDMNISEIAYECGFNDPSWFSKSFKEEYGFSPSIYKKEHEE